jgi:hypothetical protein
LTAVRDDVGTRDFPALADRLVHFLVASLHPVSRAQIVIHPPDERAAAAEDSALSATSY